jgi:hypothetical protein
MQTFDRETFRLFLGKPAVQRQHGWGIEERYVVSESSLAEYKDVLRDTLYHHHSSFDTFDEIRDLGYPLAADAMRQRDSGNPENERTQMGNLGEVMGAEFARAFLEFETTWTFPKRLNPNIDQSMKGADIIGLRNANQLPELLIGEAKSRQQFSRGSIAEAYDHLAALYRQDARKILRFAKEYIKGDKSGVANIDRHMAHNVPRHCLIFSLTQTAPRNPFDILAEKYSSYELPNLIAVHVQVRNLKVIGEERYGKTWLSKLFTP